MSSGCARFQGQRFAGRVAAARAAARHQPELPGLDGDPLAVGDVVQLWPDVGDYGGMFLVVTELVEGGVVGYVQLIGGWRHDVRARWSEIDRVGRAAWQ